MSLFEWLGERRNPGPIGTIETGAPERSTADGRAIAMRAVVAVLLFATGVVAIAVFSETPVRAMVSLGVLVAYCVVAFWVRPRPDMSNLGWGYGLIDHPFRWSDDANRYLLFSPAFSHRGASSRRACATFTHIEIGARYRGVDDIHRITFATG